MIELYADIPQAVKDRTAFVFQMALRQPNILQAVKVLHDFTAACIDEYEREYVEFYFNMRMEQLKNGNTNNQREEPSGERSDGSNDEK